MTQKERATLLFNVANANSNVFIDSTQNVCEALAQHYDFSPKVLPLEWEIFETGNRSLIQCCNFTGRFQVYRNAVGKYSCSHLNYNNSTTPLYLSDNGIDVFDTQDEAIEVANRYYYNLIANTLSI